MLFTHYIHIVKPLFIVGSSKVTTVMVVLLTGQRLELKVDPLLNTLRQLVDKIGRAHV